MEVPDDSLQFCEVILVDALDSGSEEKRDCCQYFRSDALGHIEDFWNVGLEKVVFHARYK